MAFKARNIPEELVYTLIAAQNQRQVDAISTFFHLSRMETTNRPDWTNQSVTRVAPDAAATDATTQITLANNLKSLINRHFADDTAHNTAVSAAVATADGTDTATAITLANALKAAYNTHLSAANVHYTNDGTNAVAAADATNAATLQTLVNELRTDFIAHIASAPAGTYIDIIPA